MKTIVLVVALATSPAWALYKCGPATFQETPCAAGGQQIKEQYAPPPMDAPRDMRVIESTKAMETERLRHETEYALRDKQVELDNFRSQCSAQVSALSRRGGGNITDALNAQAASQAAQAKAADCQMQTQVLQSQVDDLRRRCADQKCTPL